MKTRHIYHLCFSHYQDKTLAFSCASSQLGDSGGSGIHLHPRQATGELPGAPQNQDWQNSAFRLLRVLHPPHKTNSAGFPMGPDQHPQGSPKCLPSYLVWILPTLRDPILLLQPARIPSEEHRLHTVAGA